MVLAMCRSRSRIRPGLPLRELIESINPGVFGGSSLFGQEWGFWDTGSGGKKTLFNVCYALALHEAARERDMPVPNVLIIDSPTKNISDDENPELVHSLYHKIYRVAADGGTQFLLIDSELVEPEAEVAGFSHRRLAGEREAPSLISYYDGP